MNLQQIQRLIRRLVDSPLPRQFNLSFAGNGYIGLDVSSSGTFLLRMNQSSGFHKLPGFLPLVQLITPNSEDKALKFVPDVHEGISKAVRCSIISGHCVCVYEYVYAHRTRPNVLVQDIKFSNPSLSPVKIKFKRQISSDWEKHDGSNVPVYFRSLNLDNQQVNLAVICSSLPEDAVINQKREESFRFFCVLDHNVVGPDPVFSKRELLARTIDKFSDVNSIHWSKVDVEHKDAWAKLNKAYFNISSSKAPNALNTDLIELTKYLLLSSVRDPLLEKDPDPSAVANSKALLGKNELCYGGHSTMLTPSRLWQHWENLDDVLNVINVWLLTLNTHGCMNLVKAGAHGVVQAFLLSLTSARFTHHYLEFSLDPVGDLHRSLHVEGLEYTLGSPITIDFDMDADLRPFIRIQGSSSYKSPIFACSGGCVDEAKKVTNTVIRLPIKITKPPTPILFISSDKNVLSGLKDTLHVIEVVDAPQHSVETISRHKHGENSGLPTAFWIILICLLLHMYSPEVSDTEDDEVPRQRPVSPYLDDTKKPPVYMTDFNKIHRIRCRKGYYATVVNVVSPSEIYVRITNHITDTQLVIPNSLKERPQRVEDAEVGAYVMTPYDCLVCGRARILKLLNTGVIVRFIDHGILAFRRMNELYVMEERLRYFPWQTIKVALHNVFPVNPKSGWSPEEVLNLTKIINEYSLFWVNPQLTGADPRNDDFYPISVELNGINPEDTVVAGITIPGDELGESIVARYNMHMGQFVSDQYEDAEEQEFYPCQVQDYDLTDDPLSRVPDQPVV